MTSVENRVDNNQVKESKFSKVWQVILKGLKIFKAEFIHKVLLNYIVLQNHCI